MTGRRWDRMMDGAGNGMMGGGAWMMLLFGLILLVLLGAALFVALRVVGRGAPTVSATEEPSPGSPRDVLDLRLARGDISREEYGAARALLAQ
jgi:uncharacterized membrane protein